MTLNLCRVMYYLKEGAISSKKEGGEWAVQVVPDRYKALIRRCLDEYGGVPAHLEAEAPLLPSFAEYMQTEINRSLKERESPGNRLTKE
jgi:streptomycin 3"-adenylyltransferase